MPRKKNMILPRGYSALQPKLCDKLKDARLAAGLSQADVEKAAGISRETVTRIEAGRVPLPQALSALMQILGLEESDVFVRGKNDNPLPFVDGSRGEQLSEIGKSIIEARAARKLSLQEASKLTGISASQLSRIERGLVCRSRAFADDPCSSLAVEDRLVEITNPGLKKLIDLG